MLNRLRIAALLVAFLWAAMIPARGAVRAISLTGDYAFLAGRDYATPADLPPPDEPAWGRCPVPGLWTEATGVGVSWLRGNPPGFLGPSGWYRRTVFVPKFLNGMDGRIEVESALWGCEAWMNGVRLGRHIGGYAPFGFDCGKAVRFGAENVILFKLDGWAAIPRDDKGRPLITVGVDAPWANKSAGFTGEARLAFTYRARFESIRVMTDLEEGTVALRLRVQAREKSGGVFTAQVRGPGGAASENFGGLVSLEPGENTMEFGPVAIRDPRPWSPGNPALYTAHCFLLQTPLGLPYDRERIQFGFNRVETRGNRVLFNGEPMVFRGGSLFEEPRFKRGSDISQDTDFLRRYLVEVPKENNFNILRTHLGPMNEQWLDVCDAGGMTVLLEFPVFYYNNDPRFKEFALSEYKSLLPRLWNHPCIVLWGVSNEGWDEAQREFERNRVLPLFREFDLTRPILRVGDVDGDFADTHGYEGVWFDTMFEFVERHRDIMRRFPNRPWGDSEYLETGGGTNGVWYNRNRIRRFFDDDDWTSRDLQLKHAQLAMTQTEWLRKLDFSLMTPYWYPDWVNLASWSRHPKGEDYPKPKPTLTALRDAFSPAGIGLTQFQNRNVLEGETISVPLDLFNDRGTTFTGEALLCLCGEEPGFDPSGVAEADVVTSTAAGVALGPWTHGEKRMSLTVPEGRGVAGNGRNWKNGKVWAAAVLREGGVEVAMSRRTMRVAKRSMGRLKGVGVYALLGNEEVAAFLREEGATILVKGTPLPKGAVVVAAWDGETTGSGSRIAPEEMSKIGRFLDEGGRVVFLRQAYNYKGIEWFPKVAKLKNTTDYLFPAEDAGLPAIRNPNGLRPALRYEVTADRSGGTDRILLRGYPDSSGTAVAAVLERKVGRGTLVVCQAELADRIGPRAAHRDPICEALLAALIRGQARREGRTGKP